jgi:hypothetical protein
MKREKSSSLYQNGCVALFMAACSLVYLHSGDKKDEVIAALDHQLSNLQTEKELLLQEEEELLLQVNSQSDPAWIQMTLQKGLGLVPEGQLKVYFDVDKVSH